MGEKLEPEAVTDSEENDAAASGNEDGDVQDLGSRLHNELVILNGRINDMDKDTVIKNLYNSQLNPRGHIVVLKKRLRDYYKSKNLPPSALLTVNEILPYYVVVDFEATCNAINLPEFLHEIIEFPAILVDSKNKTIVDEFHYYVKPKLNPELSEFCTELTGITQETVNNADDFKVVLENFELWLKRHKLGFSKRKYAIVTDGPWDMSKFLSMQCKVSEVSFPRFAKKWVNLRKTYRRFYNTQTIRLTCMLEQSGLQFQGRLHSGLDDSRNIAALLIAMISDGVAIKVNESISRARLHQKRNNTNTS